jgi:hypothetical protein
MNRRRIILKAIKVVLGVAIIIFVIHCSLRFNVASYIATLKARGEPMELAQVVPPLTPVGQNGVPQVIDALTNQVTENIETNNLPTSLFVIAPGKVMAVWKQSDVCSPDGTNTWEQLGAILASAKTNLTSFRQMTNYPVLDFQLDYQKYWTVRLFHLAPLRWAAEWLSVSAIYNLHQGHMTEACADVHAMLAIVKGQTEEPLNMSQKVRMAFLYISADATWEILQSTNVSEDALVQLQQDWESLEIMKPVERAYLMQRVQEIHLLEHYRQYPDELWRGVSGHGEGIQRSMTKYYWRWYSAYADEKRAAQIYQVLVEATRLAETAHSFQMAQSFIGTGFARLGIKKPEADDDWFLMDVDEFSVGSLYSFEAEFSYSLLPRGLASETTRNLVIAAIAIKRYELQHSQPPDTLETLMPDFLKTDPIDWMDGAPLRYRHNPDGTFLLYSVGSNGVDDNGDPTMPTGTKNYSFYWDNFDARDLVWPQPATADEIKKYYADHSAKGE